jgi:hypothetical protein
MERMYLNLFIVLLFLQYLVLNIFTVSTILVTRKCNSVMILSLTIFYLNWNQYVNLHKYKIF